MQSHQQLMQPVGGVDSLRQSPLLRRGPTHLHHPSAAYSHSLYSNHYQSEYAQPQPDSRKRSRSRTDLQLDLHGLPDLQDTSHHDLHIGIAPHDHHGSQANIYTPQSTGPQSAHLSTPQHHHHRLPNQPPAAKIRRLGYDSPPPVQHGPPSVVGQEGMPAPAPRPRGTKLKFTPEDDSLLVDLKEKKNLTWKQIADFFPGRSSGTLQVRYCTKLKAKTTTWTDEMVQKLCNAIREYDNDRWRIISTKVGHGFSPAACKEKAIELSGAAALDSSDLKLDSEQQSLDDVDHTAGFDVSSLPRDSVSSADGPVGQTYHISDTGLNHAP